MAFVFQVTLQDYVIKVLNDFMARSLSRYFTILPSLAAIDTIAVEMQHLSLLHDLARPRYHVMGSLSRLSLLSLVAISTLGMEK